MNILKANDLVEEYVTKEDYKKFVYYQDALKIVELIVNEMQVEIDKLSLENSKYEAKIYAYEAILQNSNFKMAVVRKNETTQ